MYILPLIYKKDKFKLYTSQSYLKHKFKLKATLTNFEQFCSNDTSGDFVLSFPACDRRQILQRILSEFKQIN